MKEMLSSYDGTICSYYALCRIILMHQNNLVITVIRVQIDLNLVWYFITDISNLNINHVTLNELMVLMFAYII